MSLHHNCMNKRVKEKKLGVWEAFWLLCKFLKVERPIECTGLRTWIGQLLTSEIWSIKQGVLGRVPGSFMIFGGQGNCLWFQVIVPCRAEKPAWLGKRIGFGSLKYHLKKLWIYSGLLTTPILIGSPVSWGIRQLRIIILDITDVPDLNSENSPGMRAHVHQVHYSDMEK